MQLGRAFGWTRSFEGLAVHFHSHSEDGNVNWASLGNEFVLESWLQLVEPHQSVHGLGGLGLVLWSWWDGQNEDIIRT